MLGQVRLVCLILSTYSFLIFADEGSPKLSLSVNFKMQNVLDKNDVRFEKLDGEIWFTPTQDTICGKWVFGSYCHKHCLSRYVLKVGKYEIEEDFELGDTGERIEVWYNWQSDKNGLKYWVHTADPQNLNLTSATLTVDQAVVKELLKLPNFQANSQRVMIAALQRNSAIPGSRSIHWKIGTTTTDTKDGRTTYHVIMESISLSAPVAKQINESAPRN